MKKTWRLAVPVVAVALLTGCVPSGGTAFIIDGTPVSSRAVDAVVSGCATALRTQPSSNLGTNVVSWMVAGRVADTVASKTRQTVTDEQRLQFLSASPEGQAMLTNADCAQAVKGFAAYSILRQLISAQSGQAAFDAEVRKISVQVNPRYGSWDARQGKLGIGTGSLSSPAPTQTTNP